MRILRYFFYTVIIFIIILIPIYGAARLILPDYIKKEIIKNLPKGSTLSIGSVTSKVDLGINFKNVNFTYPGNKISLETPMIEILPQLNLNQPLKILAPELNYKNSKSSGKLNKLKIEILFNNNNKDQVDLFGEIKELKSTNLLEFSELKFLLEGINNKNKYVSFDAKKIIFNFENDFGFFELSGNNLVGNTTVNDNISSSLKIEDLNINLTEIRPRNANRIINSEQGRFEFTFNSNKNLNAPINIELKKSRTPIDSFAEKISISTTASWRDSKSSCNFSNLFDSNDQCGVLTDFLNTNILVEDRDGGKFLIVGNGICVTPNAGCIQRINAEISSKKTTEIFSKVMVSGVINPLLGGVLLSGLLTSPHENIDDFDHKLNFKMMGSKILINNKPLF